MNNFNKRCQYSNPYNMYGYSNFSYIRDYGPEPIVVNMEDITKQNNTFRTVLWTGNHMQLTLMSLNPGESIGLEMHPNIDQFIRIEQGRGLVQIGNAQNNFTIQKKVFDNNAFIIPAGKWHNLTNIGENSLKLYSIYAPPNHSKGTIHYTKKDAEH